MRRYALRDDRWDRIKDFLPGREGHAGGTAADNRLFVEAVVHRYRCGIPWRDLPQRFGDWKIVCQRFNRWAKSGVCERIFKLLARDHDNECQIASNPDPLSRPIATPLGGDGRAYPRSA
jgi:transposase